MVAVLNAEQFIDSLARLVSSSLYVLHGEEELLKIECLDALRSEAKQQGYGERRTFIVEQTSFDWSEIINELGNNSLFSDLKLVEIHIPSGKPGKTGADVLQNIAENLPSDVICVIVLPKLDRQQQQAKWFTALGKQAKVVELKAVGVDRLPEWIQQRLKKCGLSIQADALGLFVERVEGNLLAAKQEVDKLALIYPSGYCLELEDAQKAVANVARFDIFQLSAAWMGQDLSRLSKLLESFEVQGEEPVLLLWAISEDIRTLIKLSAALKQGKSIYQVRNELRLWGDKQHLAAQAVKRISVTRLVGALEQCAQIDRQIKGAESGDAWNCFKELAMSLAA